LPKRLYSLCRIGSNEPELQGIQEKREKETSTPQKNEKKRGHSEKTSETVD
jgi:hypothetical protein